MSVYTAAAVSLEVDDGYTDFERLIAARVAAAVGPLFTTDADPEKLWAAYLESIPAERRQHYNCHACRRFIQTYGGLVSIDPDFGAVSVLWGGDFGDVPAFFRPAVARLGALMSGAAVTGVFIDASPVWGTATAGGWSHLCGIPKTPFLASATKSAGQVAAEKREDRGILARSLADYSLAAVCEAVRVLESGTLTRSEKAEGVARWFRGVHESLTKCHDRRRRDNVLWLAAATAPPGFCHVRNTVLGTLLDDLTAGHSFDVVAKRWAEKLHPLQYQRPTAAPKAGQIDAAEKLVASLGLAPALARRFATLEDVLATLWTPKPAAPQPTAAAGVFGHLRTPPAGVRPLELPAVRMTWEKFARTVLPGAVTLEVRVPTGRANFYGLTTAADPTAPPLLQWDGLTDRPRNPASVYVYAGCSDAERWNLTPGAWAAVSAVFLSPHEWQAPELFGHYGRRVLFALAGAWDKYGDRCGLCLFPQDLRGELRGARHVIEAHSKAGALIGKEQGTANGLAFPGAGELTVYATTAGPPALYTLDRLD